MFNPNDQMLVPLVAIRQAFVLTEFAVPTRPAIQKRERRTVRRARPNVVRLIPGVTKLPIGYSPR